MIKIRKVRKDEAPLLQKLNNEVFIDNAKYDKDLVLDWAFSEAGKEYFQKLAVSEKDLCLVAENEEGKLVGYLAASHIDFDYRHSKYLEINNMGVVPEHRSQGIGEKLMEKCTAWAKENGYQRVYANSYFANYGAVKFYEKCGFNKIDVSLERDV